ncbi:MAG TPA: Flp family type IVb pilin [Thermoguttaceae bacterium]|nr:Flp family type IVb pilin [Thermoguttaceae bacterium]
MLTVLRSFWTGEEGATAVEYGLMVALIAGTIVVTVTALGVGVNNVFTTVEAAISAA